MDEKETAQTVLPEVLTIGQAAEFLGLHRKTVQRYCRDGILRSARCGRTYRVRREWILEFLDRGGC